MRVGKLHLNIVRGLLHQARSVPLPRNRTAQIGDLLATVLAGSWRRSPQSLQVSEASLSEIIPQLVGSMSGALAWWKIRHTDLRASRAAIELQQTYRSHSIGSKLREHSIKQVLGVLYSEGIEPILVKGWAIARLYPEPGLRPYGDIDLVVRPDQHADAQVAIRGLNVRYWIDLHRGFGRLDYRPPQELYMRSTIVKLDELDVRVLAPEDHFRLLCTHMLHHSVHRPLWLCDIAAALEYRSRNFDWDVCLGKSKVRANWITCAIGLANMLLGAEVAGTPVEGNQSELPRWLVSQVLKKWEAPYSMSQAPATHRAEMARYLRDPRGLFGDLRRRWPDPIEATVYVGGRFNDFPRVPFQVGECAARAARFVASLPKALRDER
ncbi:MAG: nucleotidyltransferase family protein [Blastocatellia bacterium]